MDTNPLGTDLPEGVRFIGPEVDWESGWATGDAPSTADLNACVACGLCLPHCPTYRLTGEESASPRGRITAMRAVHEGRAATDETFARFMDLCLVCRACEDVCPSHVPFGRMMEAARTQIEPLRSRRALFVRWLGLDVVLPSKKLTWLAGSLAPLARPFMPRRIRALIPRGGGEPFARLPHATEPEGEVRGSVALLSGCVQDRWFRRVNRATIRVLARKNMAAFASVDHVVVNAAGCGSHMQAYGDLAEGTALPVRDLMEFLHETGVIGDTGSLPELTRVAYHDACHALRAQGIHDQPRQLLGEIGNLELVEIPNGDRCCGAAGLYNITEPEMSGRLMREKAEAVVSTGAAVVASGNPGCTMQLLAGLAEIGKTVDVVHPIELLDAATR